MQESWADETDLQLLHLMQIAPRISWTSAGEVLGLSASAAATRWTRLRKAGLAWIAVYPSPISYNHITAFVDVDCSPKHREDLAQQLCRDARVVSVDESARGRDLLLTVLVTDLEELSRFLLDDLVPLRGVRDTRTRLVTAVHFEGADWRLDSLDSTQRRQAAASVETQVPKSATAPTGEQLELVRVLSGDARLSVAEMARLTGRNPATVRRHLGQLLDSGVLSIRCAIAPQISGWPIECSWLVRVAPTDLAHTVASLRTLSQLRMCMTVTGNANLIFTTFSRTVQDLYGFEQKLGHALPQLNIIETMVHLRSRKRMGWMLQSDGRSTGAIVVPETIASTTS